jgi:hypothetical protein
MSLSPLHASEQKTSPTPLGKCQEKLLKRYGEQGVRSKKFSSNDSEVAQLISVAGMIANTRVPYNEQTAKHPGMKIFSNFITLLQDPAKEKINPQVGVAQLQAVLLDPLEIAHMLVEGNNRGILCPNYKNPSYAATHDVYMSPTIIRGHIRNGTIPSLISYIDEAVRRNQHKLAPPQQSSPKKETPLVNETPVINETPVVDETPVKEKHEETLPPPLPLKTGEGAEPKKEVPSKEVPVTAKKAQNFIDDITEPTDAKDKKHKNKNPMDDDSSSEEPTAASPKNRGRDPYGSIDFLSKKK